MGGFQPATTTGLMLHLLAIERKEANYSDTRQWRFS
jgi:hypothetical protein